jgi:hypothetical protein
MGAPSPVGVAPPVGAPVLGSPPVGLAPVKASTPVKAPAREGGATAVKADLQPEGVATDPGRGMFVRRRREGA